MTALLGCVIPERHREQDAKGGDQGRRPCHHDRRPDGPWHVSRRREQSISIVQVEVRPRFKHGHHSARLSCPQQANCCRRSAVSGQRSGRAGGARGGGGFRRERWVASCCSGLGPMQHPVCHIISGNGTGTCGANREQGIRRGQADSCGSVIFVC